jgi:hypothetical protein
MFEEGREYAVLISSGKEPISRIDVFYMQRHKAMVQIKTREYDSRSKIESKYWA